MTEGAARRPHRTRRHYERGTEDFGRVLAFSDAVFAIAMTLLVVSIGVPTVPDEASLTEMLAALDDLLPEIVSFAVSFAVIGRYWLAHHRFVALLRAVDARLITLNLVYLAFIAFLPFPTDLLGNYFENPIAVAAYAGTVAVVSAVEVALFSWAYHTGLLGRRISRAVFWWGFRRSISPVVFFLASIPLAFVSPWLAVLVWVLPFPLFLVSWRHPPPGAEEELPG